MKPFRPVRWPCYIWWRDELPPRRRYLLFGPRDQGSRTASNYGFLIVAKKGTPSHILEQEKFESRYWVTHFYHAARVFPYFYLAPMLDLDHEYGHHPLYQKAAEHLCRVECMSRAHEIRARNHKTHEDWTGLVDYYAHSITHAKNYPFFKAAGWDEERTFNEILRWL